MTEKIIELLGPMGQELTLLIVSVIPFIELRGGIILGHGFGMDPLKVFAICFLANCVPVPFVVFLAKPMFRWLKKFRLFNKIITKIEDLVERKSSKVTAYKYEMLGLFLFVGIPLPGTGAYTGSLIAALLNMRLKYAVPAIILGVFAAGVIMTLASMGLFSALGWVL